MLCFFKLTTMLSIIQGSVYMNDKSQLLKGVLEGCILKIIYHRTQTYGYAIVEELRSYGFGQCTEGTIYPLLTRLEKKSILKSEKKDSPFGPKRKYYSLTENGLRQLNYFYDTWLDFKEFVDKIFMDYGKNNNL